MFCTVLRCLVLLAGMACSGCTLAAFEVMEEVDRAVSKLAQSDCEIVRIAHFKPICSDPDKPPPQPPVYCYRRLGGVDCYASRDPDDKPIVDRPVSIARPMPQEPGMEKPATSEPAMDKPRMSAPPMQKPAMDGAHPGDAGDDDPMEPHGPVHHSPFNPGAMAERLASQH